MKKFREANEVFGAKPSAAGSKEFGGTTPALGKFSIFSETNII